ncbi:MAG: ATP-binding protein [Nitrospirota bacterium]
MSPLQRIYPRIALSFAAVVVVALLSAALLFLSLVSRAGEERLGQDMERAAQVMSRFGATLGDGLVQRLAQVLGNEVAIIGPGDKVMSSSLPAEQWPDLAEQLRGHLRPDGPRGTGRTFSVSLPAGQFAALVRPLQTSAGLSPDWLALLSPNAPEKAWKRKIATKVAWVTAGAIALVALLGHHLARRITRPIQELSAVAGDIAAGDRGRRVGAIGYGEVRDLATAFDAMAAQLRDTEERRLAAERQAVAGRLAGTVAHEVRNPLSSVRMLVQMIRNRLVDSEDFRTESRYADLILNEIERVEIVLQGLLDLSHPRPLRLRPTDVEAVLDEVVSLTRAHLEHRQVQLQRDTSGTSRSVEADPGRLKQVALNLILNGCNAMPDGGTLRVATHWPAGEARVEIHIDDTGHGLDPERAEHLFEPFQTTREGGVGIGLAISRQIAREHGGDVTLTSLPQGTRATAWFPIR